MQKGGGVMKRVSPLVMGIALALLAFSLSQGQARAQAKDVVVSGATVDITHFSGKDQIDLTATFTNNELAELHRCEPAENLNFHGVKVTVQPGFCGTLTTKSNI